MISESVAHEPRGQRPVQISEIIPEQSLRDTLLTQAVTLRVSCHITRPIAPDPIHCIEQSIEQLGHNVFSLFPMCPVILQGNYCDN
jgi:hypothetical protein